MAASTAKKVLFSKPSLDTLPHACSWQMRATAWLVFSAFPILPDVVYLKVSIQYLLRSDFSDTVSDSVCVAQGT